MCHDTSVPLNWTAFALTLTPGVQQQLSQSLEDELTGLMLSRVVTSMRVRIDMRAKYMASLLAHQQQQQKPQQQQQRSQRQPPSNVAANAAPTFTASLGAGITEKTTQELHKPRDTRAHFHASTVAMSSIPYIAGLGLNTGVAGQKWNALLRSANLSPDQQLPHAMSTFNHAHKRISRALKLFISEVADHTHSAARLRSPLMTLEPTKEFVVMEKQAFELALTELAWRIVQSALRPSLDAAGLVHIANQYTRLRNVDMHRQFKALVYRAKEIQALQMRRMTSTPLLLCMAMHTESLRHAFRMRQRDMLVLPLMTSIAVQKEVGETLFALRSELAALNHSLYASRVLMRWRAMSHYRDVKRVCKLLMNRYYHP